MNQRLFVLQVALCYLVIQVLPGDWLFFSLALSPRSLLFLTAVLGCLAWRLLDPLKKPNELKLCVDAYSPVEQTKHSAFFSLTWRIWQRLKRHKEDAIWSWVQSKLDNTSFLPGAFRSPKLIALSVEGWPTFSKLQKTRETNVYTIDFYYDSEGGSMTLLQPPKIQVVVSKLNVAGRIRLRLMPDGKLMLSLVRAPMLTVQIKPSIFDSIDINVESLRQSLNDALLGAIMKNVVQSEVDIGYIEEYFGVPVTKERFEEHADLAKGADKLTLSLNEDEFEIVEEHQPARTPRDLSSEFLPIGRINCLSKSVCCCDVDGKIHLFVNTPLFWQYSPISSLLGAPPIPTGGRQPLALAWMDNPMKCVAFSSMNQLFLMKKMKKRDSNWQFSAIAGLPDAESVVSLFFQGGELNIVYITTANQLLHISITDLNAEPLLWDIHVLAEDLCAFKECIPEQVRDKKNNFVGLIYTRDLAGKLEMSFASMSELTKPVVWQHTRLPPMSCSSMVASGHMRADVLQFAFVSDLQKHVVYGYGSDVRDIVDLYQLYAEKTGVHLADAVAPCSTFSIGADDYVVFRTVNGELLCFYGGLGSKRLKLAKLLEGEDLVAIGAPEAVPVGINSFRVVFAASDQCIYKISGSLMMGSQMKLVNLTKTAKIRTID